MKTGSTSNRVALGVMTVIFFMWGFLTSLNDVLIPHLKTLFDLNYTQIMLVQFTFFGAYFLMSAPSGRVVRLIGYKKSIAAGLTVSAVGAFLFYPAAAIPSYGLFLTAFFILATGITLLQVAANPYVSLLGPARTASSRLNLAQALNSLGTTLAPKFGGILILSGTVLGAAQLAQLPVARQLAYKIHQAHLVQGPYLGLGALLLVLALGVLFFRLPVFKEHEAPEKQVREESLMRSAMRHPHLFCGIFAIFVYVGAEVSIGSFMINYISLPDIGNISPAKAANYVALYWGGAMIGRFIGAALLQKMDPRRLLGVFALVAAALISTTMLASGSLAVWSIVVIGLFNSIMFPNIFTLGIRRMGHLTGTASSLLIMAIVGGAVIPLAQGAIADRIGVHHAFLLPLVCYLYIAFYGFVGSRIRSAPEPEEDETAHG
ncbi:MAG: sugar MFS transporter [Gammaproteobacteria bacterium]